MHLELLCRIGLCRSHSFFQARHPLPQSVALRLSLLPMRLLPFRIGLPRCRLLFLREQAPLQLLLLDLGRALGAAPPRRIRLRGSCLLF